MTYVGGDGASVDFQRSARCFCGCAECEGGGTRYDVSGAACADGLVLPSHIRLYLRDFVLAAGDYAIVTNELGNGAPTGEPEEGYTTGSALDELRIAYYNWLEDINDDISPLAIRIAQASGPGTPAGGYYTTTIEVGGAYLAKSGTPGFPEMLLQDNTSTIAGNAWRDYLAKRFRWRISVWLNTSDAIETGAWVSIPTGWTRYSRVRIEAIDQTGETYKALFDSIAAPLTCSQTTPNDGPFIGPFLDSRVTPTAYPPNLTIEDWGTYTPNAICPGNYSHALESPGAVWIRMCGGETFDRGECVQDYYADFLGNLIDEVDPDATNPPSYKPSLSWESDSECMPRQDPSTLDNNEGRVWLSNAADSWFASSGKLDLRKAGDSPTDAQMELIAQPNTGTGVTGGLPAILENGEWNLFDNDCAAPSSGGLTFFRHDSVRFHLYAFGFIVEFNYHFTSSFIPDATSKPIVTETTTLSGNGWTAMRICKTRPTAAGTYAANEQSLGDHSVTFTIVPQS